MTTKRIKGMLAVLVGVMLSQDALAFYNSSTGRWLKRDPIKEDGGLNIYGFVFNSPIVHWDILGKKCCLITYLPGAYGSGYSIGGHSVLSCDNGAYISFFPQDENDPSTQWHSPEQDANDYSGGPEPIKTCFECLDESKVAEWLANARTSEEWRVHNNCSDATAMAIIAGLPNETKPDCGCYPGWSKKWRVVDLMDHSGINFPSETRSAVGQVVANGCKRYKCKLEDVPYRGRPH